MKMNVYLAFNGEAYEAIHFYKEVFKTELCYPVVRYKEMGMTEDGHGDYVAHSGIMVGDNVLMASDMTEPVNKTLRSNTEIILHGENINETETVFQALSEGGEVEIPLEKQMWGDYYGKLKDKFGIAWSIMFAPKN